MTREERRRVPAHEHVDLRLRERAMKVIEQRRGEHDVAQPAQLNEENALDSWRHSRCR